MHAPACHFHALRCRFLCNVAFALLCLFPCFPFFSFLLAVFSCFLCLCFRLAFPLYVSSFHFYVFPLLLYAFVICFACFVLCPCFSSIVLCVSLLSWFHSKPIAKLNQVCHHTPYASYPAVRCASKPILRLLLILQLFSLFISLRSPIHVLLLPWLLFP